MRPPGLIDTPTYGEGEASEAFKSHLGQSVLFPKRLGTWYVKAGVQYYHIANDALLAAQQFNFATTTFPGAKDDIVLVNGGFGFSF